MIEYKFVFLTISGSRGWLATVGQMIQQRLQSKQIAPPAKSTDLSQTNGSNDGIVPEGLAGMDV